MLRFTILTASATVYAEMLGNKIDEHNAQVFLVNTGWTGGVYGVGNRMDLKYTRTMVRAAIEGKLNDAKTVQDPIFGLHMPVEIPGVPAEVLNPRNTWENGEAYDKEANTLAALFHETLKNLMSEDITKKADHCLKIWRTAQCTLFLIFFDFSSKPPADNFYVLIDIMILENTSSRIFSMLTWYFLVKGMSKWTFYQRHYYEDMRINFL